MTKDLQSAGSSILEKMQVVTILNSLPPSLDMDTTTLRMSSTILKVTDLPTRLAIEQDIIHRRNDLELNLQEANAAHNKPKYKGNKAHNCFTGPNRPQFKRKSQQKEKRVPHGACYKCGKFGHFQANCPHGKQGNKG